MNVTDLGASQLSALIHGRKLSCRDVMQVFLERIQRLRAQPPGAGWDGTWTLDAK